MEGPSSVCPARTHHIRRRSVRDGQTDTDKRRPPTVRRGDTINVHLLHARRDRVKVMMGEAVRRHRARLLSARDSGAARAGQDFASDVSANSPGRTGTCWNADMTGWARKEAR